MQAELPDDAELVAERDGLASLNPLTPARDGDIERDRAVFAPMLRDKVEEAVELELAAPVGHAHGTLELDECPGILPQLRGGDGHGHIGTGNEISRSDWGAILTYAEIDSGSRCPSSSDSTSGRVPRSIWRAALEWRSTWLPR